MRVSRRSLLGALAAPAIVRGKRGDAETVARVGEAPIAVHDNKVWIAVRFGGRGPFDFTIDTGAGNNIISLDLARSLGLRELGERRIAGIGGTRQVVVCEGREVAFGNVGIGTVTFRAPVGDAGRHRGGGALSASMLTVADSDLDFEAGRWRIYPDGRGDRTGFESLPAEIQRDRQWGARIFVTAEIDGQRYRLQLDTGAPPGLFLYPRAAARSGLWNDATPYSPGRARGIGGPGPRTRLVRVGRVGLGGIGFDRPLVVLSEPRTSNLLHGDGLFGLKFLQQLNLTSEVRANRLWGRRNALPPPAEDYNMSGVWMDAAQGGLVVALVSPHSPGADAGLRPGDRIGGLSIDQWVAMLDAPAGSAIDLAYRRDGMAGTARLTLRPYL